MNFLQQDAYSQQVMLSVQVFFFQGRESDVTIEAMRGHIKVEKLGMNTYTRLSKDLLCKREFYDCR